MPHGNIIRCVSYKCTQCQCARQHTHALAWNNGLTHFVNQYFVIVPLGDIRCSKVWIMLFCMSDHKRHMNCLLHIIQPHFAKWCTKILLGYSYTRTYVVVCCRCCGRLYVLLVCISLHLMHPTQVELSCSCLYLPCRINIHYSSPLQWNLFHFEEGTMDISSHKI